MPKVSIYLSDDQYREVKAHDLPLSALAQDAVEQALAGSRRAQWVAGVRARDPRHHGRIDTAELLAGARAEFGA